jgi:hypothetical protein
MWPYYSLLSWVTCGKNHRKPTVVTSCFPWQDIYPGQFKPSLSHRFIHQIEANGCLLRNYSQNIDTLEQIAGITKIIQCHGKINFEHWFSPNFCAIFFFHWIIDYSFVHLFNNFFYHLWLCSIIYSLNC